MSVPVGYRFHGARSTVVLALALAVATLGVGYLAVERLRAQTATAGTFHKPVPAPKGYGPSPGCIVGFTPPTMPDPPDFPCAATCTGPQAPTLTLEDVAASCKSIGPQKYSHYDQHPDFPDKTFAPKFGPKGSSTCFMATGDPGMPNGTMWFPNGHPRCGGVRGDPHVTTFDRQRVDLHAAGEFVAAMTADRAFEVQVRLEPQDSPFVSMATAVAARVVQHRLMVTAGDGPALHIDGAPVELPDGFAVHIADGRASVIHLKGTYSIVWPDGTNAHVRRSARYVDLTIMAAEPLDGRLVGLLGNADGRRDGVDFATRDGRSLGDPPDFATLHGAFADAWRIDAATSLFTYAEGESTDTFTRRDVPTRRMTRADLAADDRARAERRCREAGVRHPDAFEDCVVDLAVTGDDTFIASALAQQPPAELAAVLEQGDGTVTLDAPAEGIAAHRIEVAVRGPAARGYWVGFAPADSAPDGQAANPYSAVILRGGATVVGLIVPTLPGAYELRYRDVRDDLTARARRAFRVVAPRVTLDAPGAVDAGTTLTVQAIGDVGEFMSLVLVPAGQPDGADGPAPGLRQGGEGAATIALGKTPPGAYEIRCVSNGGASRQVYARRPLTIR